MSYEGACPFCGASPAWEYQSLADVYRCPVCSGRVPAEPIRNAAKAAKEKAKADRAEKRYVPVTEAHKAEEPPRKPVGGSATEEQTRSTSVRGKAEPSPRKR